MPFDIDCRDADYRKTGELMAKRQPRVRRRDRTGVIGVLNAGTFTSTEAVRAAIGFELGARPVRLMGAERHQALADAPDHPERIREASDHS